MRFGLRRFVKPIKRKAARRMRKNPTPAEGAFWDAYRSLKRHHLRVPMRRQAILLGYIADFWFCSRRVILELDGGYHQTQEQKAYDQRRDSQLKAAIKGLRVIRVDNSEVLKDPAKFVKEFIAMLKTLPVYGNWSAKKPRPAVQPQGSLVGSGSNSRPATRNTSRSGSPAAPSARPMYGRKREGSGEAVRTLSLNRQASEYLGQASA